MKTSVGLCIGGPLDGMMYQATGEIFKVAILPDIEFVPVPVPEAFLGPDIEERVYTLLPSEGGDFWLYEGETLATMVTKLSKAYMKIARMKRRRKNR